jgi:glycosyltransferase involved in cell wall biosynthesis
MRLAIIGIAPAPYRDRLFERIANAPHVEPRVFYLHNRDSLRGWTAAPLSYPAEYVPCLTPERFYHLPLLGAVNPALPRSLAAFAPDCLLVYGHSFLAQYQAVRWAIERRVPYFLRCDSNPYNIVASRSGRPSRWRAAKSWIIRKIGSRAAGVLTIGTANGRFWEHYGVPADKRIFAPFSVDNEWFERQSRLHRANREQLRQEMELPQGRILLFAGRFVEAKNLRRLLAACQGFAARGVSLLLAGGGPLEAALRGQAARQTPRNIHFRPFQNQAEMPKYYALADGLILPSLFEPWGLAVNEAMASGLPVFVSQRCGCAEDLVQPGENGMIFDPFDDGRIRDCLRSFAEFSDSALQRMGQRSREIVEPWNADRAAASFLDAFRGAAGG